MYDSIIYLVSEKETDQKNEYGDPITELVKRPVNAEEKSIRQSEFYQAQTDGVKPEIMFEIPDYLDYQNEQQVIYSKKLYQVLRTYRKKGKTLEIVVYGGVRDASTEISN